MLRIAVVNNFESYIDKINHIINKAMFNYNCEYKIYNYIKTNDFFQTLKKNQIDILLVDTYLPDINTSQFLNRIKKEDSLPYIIYTFSMKLHLEDFIGLNVFAFINNDTIGESLSSCIISCVKLIYNRSTILKIQGGYANIKESQIIYIEHINRKVICHTEDSDYCIVGDTLKSLSKRINSSNLMYINRSVLVNVNYIEKLCDGYIFMKHCQTKLFLSKEKEKMIRFLFDNYVKLFSFKNSK